jgi:hypothetical protein
LCILYSWSGDISGWYAYTYCRCSNIRCKWLRKSCINLYFYRKSSYNRGMHKREIFLAIFPLIKFLKIAVSLANGDFAQCSYIYAHQNFWKNFEKSTRGDQGKFFARKKSKFSGVFVHVCPYLSARLRPLGERIIAVKAWTAKSY